MTLDSDVGEEGPVPAAVAVVGDGGAKTAGVVGEDWRVKDEMGGTAMAEDVTVVVAYVVAGVGGVGSCSQALWSETIEWEPIFPGFFTCTPLCSVSAAPDSGSSGGGRGEGEDEDGDKTVLFLWFFIS